MTLLRFIKTSHDLATWLFVAATIGFCAGCAFAVWVAQTWGGR